MTTAIAIILQGDGCWPDLAPAEEKKVHHLANDAPPLQIAVLDMGMESGRPSLMLRADLPDGSVALIEVTMRNFLAAARILQERWPGV